MRKIVTIMIIFITSLTLVGIYKSQEVHAVETDIGGSSSVGSSGTIGSAKKGYSLQTGPILKVSLVDISGEKISVVSSHYYVYRGLGSPNSGSGDTEFYYKVLRNSSNAIGKYQVCGLIIDGEYTSKCESIKNKMTLSTGKWFENDSMINNGYKWGLTIEASKIENYVKTESGFKQIVNALNIKTLIGGKEFSFDTLTNADIVKLSKYRIIAEPVYVMEIDKGIASTRKFKFATLKGWANIIIDEEKTKKTNPQLGANEGAIIKNMVAEDIHGPINKTTKINVAGSIVDIGKVTETNGYNMGDKCFNVNRKSYCPKAYYSLANANIGYGYGIFYVLGECDPKKSCCYDKSGNFHKDYYGKFSVDSDGNKITNYKYNTKGKLVECLDDSKCDPLIECCYDSYGNQHEDYSGTKTNYKYVDGKLTSCLPKDQQCNVETECCYEKTTDNKFVYHAEYSGTKINYKYDKTSKKYVSCVQEKCNPKVSCCYDEIGQYHEEYKGSDENFKIGDDGILRECPIRITSCNPKKDPTPSSCIKNEEQSYIQITNESISNNRTPEKIESGTPEYNKYNFIPDSLADNCGKNQEGQYEIKKTIQGTMHVTQKLSKTITQTATSIYSGGGFELSAEYNGEISYKTCGITEYIIEDYYKDSNGNCKAIRRGFYIDNKNSTEWTEFTELAQNKIETDFTVPKIKAKNSNDESKTELEEIGYWQEDYYTDSDGKISQWNEGEKLTYRLFFNQKKACINRKTSEISYIDAEDTCSDDYIDGGQKYYVPIKYDGKFNYNINIVDLNMLNTKEWNISYACDIDVEPYLIPDPPDPGNPDPKSKKKLLYRAIDLKNPFPEVNTRLAMMNKGFKWNFERIMNLKKDSSGEVESKNLQEQIFKTKSEEILEYNITLTPQDINKIKQENENMYNEKLNYTSFDKITNNGTSKYLNELGENIVKRKNVKYNYLGECSGNNCYIYVK